MSNSDRWLLMILDGTQAEAEGEIEIDTQGGVVIFRDDAGGLTDFFNLGALASGHLVKPEEEDDE